MSIVCRIGFSAVAALLAAAPAASQPVVRVTVGLNGAQPDGEHGEGVVSGDGRFVAFVSLAANLVAGDTNTSADVFVRDVSGATTSRVSLASDGQQPTGHSGLAVGTSFGVQARQYHISDDGRYVVFVSRAALVAGDTGECVVPGETTASNCPDVYLRDRQTNETVRLSVAPGGANANGSSGGPRISGDGRFIVFESDATNLVAGDTNGVTDVFIAVPALGVVDRASVGAGGAQVDLASTSPSISDDGSIIGFLSASQQLSAEPDPVACELRPGSTQLEPCVRPFIFDRGRGHVLRVPMPVIQTTGVLPGSTPVPYTLRVDARSVAVADNGRSVAAGVTTVSSLRRQGIPIIEDRGWIHDRELGRIIYDQLHLTPIAWTGTLLAFDTYIQGPQATPTDAGALGLFEPGWSLGESVPGGSTPTAQMTNVSDDGRWVAYSTLEAVSGDDTNTTRDVYLLDRDADADGMPSAWESQFGLDPATADGGADPDADGVTNFVEYAYRGSHPRGTHVRYLAEGAHNAFFQTAIAVVGLGGSGPGDQTAVVRYSKPLLHRWSETLTLIGNRPHYAALDVQLMSDFSAVIESDGPIAVDRVMTWGGGYGSHAETASAAPATTWYLAEGATHGAFDLFYLIQNPNPAAFFDVSITYLRPAPLPPIVRSLTLYENSRTTIQVDAVPGLGATDVSAVITAGFPILVERSMYMTVGTPPQVFGAGHAGAGLTALNSRWFLAEGATGPFFDLYYLLANPTSEAARARVTYLLPSRAPIVKEYVVAAQSRLTISVKGEDPALLDTPVSAIVESLDGPRLVVERSMWWPGGGQWQEGHLAAGTTSASRRWELAAGHIGGPTNEQMFVLIANASDVAGTATIRVEPEHFVLGAASTTVTLPPNSRTTVPMHQVFSQLSGERIATSIESNGPEIVVERAMYSDYNGVVWAAGSAALGTPIP